MIAVSERLPMPARRNWTREEELKAFALYFILPTRKHLRTNPDVIALANEIGRTPGSISFKLGNLKAIDPMRKDKGLSHASKLDIEIWEEYAQRGDELTAEAMELLFEPKARTVNPGVDIEYIGRNLPEGKERKVVATARANQSYFRHILLENYNRQCCLTGLGLEPLLVASHIKPWKDADPTTERLSPENGLLLNALHDRAFDQGLITIDKSLRIVVSRTVPKRGANDTPEFEYLWRFNRHPINVPGPFRPRREFIEYHNDVVFRG